MPPNSLQKLPPATRQPTRPPLLKMDELQSMEMLAKLFFAAKTVPSGAAKWEQVLVVMVAGREIGLSATQAVANGYLNENSKTGGNKVCFYGDCALALVRGSMKLEKITETVVGLGTNRVATCTVIRVGEPDARAFSYSMEDAKSAGLVDKRGPWQTSTARMLTMRARAFALRDVFGDVLGGIGIVEEEQDNDYAAVAGGGGESSSVAEGAAEPVKKIRQRKVETLPAPAITLAIESPLIPAQDDPLPTSPAVALVTEAQLTEITALKTQYMTVVKKIAADDRAAIRTVWLEFLGNYGLSSALGITAAQADMLIARLNEMMAEESFL